jgi:amino acid adenylation domain-containing protein
VKVRALEAQQYQDIPFEQVVERVQPVRSLAHTPLFQVKFVWQNAPTGRLELPGITMSALTAEERAPYVGAKFDLGLSLRETDGGIIGEIEYSTALFDHSTVTRYAGYLRRLLSEMVADDQARIVWLPLLSAAEKQALTREANPAVAAYPSESCIQELFEAQVARTPDAIAVVFEGDQLTYTELNCRANQQAHYLRGLGVGPDARVGLCLERGLAMVISILGVLKAGGSYVPLDPSYPAERLRFMLSDSAPIALLTTQTLRERLGELFSELSLPIIDISSEAWSSESVANLNRMSLTSQHLAYVMYTSGSSGTPKGAMATHRGVVNLVHWYTNEFGIAPADGVLVVTSFSFDLTQRNLFGPLFVGGRVHLASEPFEPQTILAQIAAEGIRVMNLTVTAFHALLDAELSGFAPVLSGLRLVILGGEPPQPQKLLHLQQPTPELVNAYGPTECSGVVLCHRMPLDRSCYLGRSVPLGYPIANSRIYVMNDHQDLVPPGAVGEIYIGGVPVGRGYLRRPALTAERFVPDPFIGDPGARVYRTGDLGRRLSNGAIEFLGRIDFQVKVRGYRIEPQEVEAGLLAHPGVQECVVVAREHIPGDTRLVAYFVTGSFGIGLLRGDGLHAETLRRHLAARLPEYMLPAAYVRLSALPMTPNRKVDRRALPTPLSGDYARRGYDAPVGAIEKVISEIWARTLGLDRVGRFDHFFDIGGHSLSAIQVVARVKARFGVDVLVRSVFSMPRLEAFSAEVERLLYDQVARMSEGDAERLLGFGL